MHKRNPYERCLLPSDCERDEVGGDCGDCGLKRHKSADHGREKNSQQYHCTAPKCSIRVRIAKATSEAAIPLALRICAAAFCQWALKFLESAM